MAVLTTNRMEMGTVLTAPAKRNEHSEKYADKVMIVMLNDDVTTMNYVVDVLVGVFGFSFSDARETMMLIHTTGSGFIGFYPEDEALILLEKVDAGNKIHGFPLRCVIIDNRKNRSLG